MSHFISQKNEVGVGVTEYSHQSTNCISTCQIQIDFCLNCPSASLASN